MIERDHYDQAGIAVLTTIGIFTTSNWNSQWYNTNIDFGSPIVLYYIAWIFVGNWMLFNMFVAILIDGIAQEKKSKFRRQEQIIAERINKFFVGLSEQQIDEMIESMFLEADRDQSGMIDASEFEWILVKKWEIDLEPRESVLLFRKYDEDDSGLISPSEFNDMIKELLNMAKNRLRAHRNEMVIEKFHGLSEQRFIRQSKAMFEVVDKDKTGMAAIEALRTFLGNDLDIEYTEEEFGHLVEMNRLDGNVGAKITIREFQSVLRYILDNARKNEQRKKTESVLDALKPPLLANGRVIPSEHADESPEHNPSQRPTGDDEAEPKSPLKALVLQSQEADVAAASPLKRNKKMDSMQSFTSESLELVAPRSLFCMGPTHPFRRACAAVLDYPPGTSEASKWFGNFILICILASSCALALDGPRVGPSSSLALGLVQLNSVLLVFFNIECVLKIVSESFWGYMKSPWNRLDIFIVFTANLDALLSAVLSGNVSALKFFKILRILRALRPLRLIARAKSLRVLVSALFESIVPIISTCSLMFLAYGMCSLLGMQILSGKMKTCSNPQYFTKQDCVIHLDPNTNALGQWTTAQMNWDGFFNGLAAMFILSSQDNWQVYMVSPQPFVTRDFVRALTLSSGARGSGKEQTLSAGWKARSGTTPFSCPSSTCLWLSSRASLSSTSSLPSLSRLTTPPPIRSSSRSRKQSSPASGFPPSMTTPAALLAC